MQESEDKIITLTGVDDGALEELVNFAYCGKVDKILSSVTLICTMIFPTFPYSCAMHR